MYNVLKLTQCWVPRLELTWSLSQNEKSFSLTFLSKSWNFSNLAAASSCRCFCSSICLLSFSSFSAFLKQIRKRTLKVKHVFECCYIIIYYAKTKSPLFWSRVINCILRDVGINSQIWWLYTDESILFGNILNEWFIEDYCYLTQNLELSFYHKERGKGSKASMSNEIWGTTVHFIHENNILTYFDVKFNVFFIHVRMCNCTS